MTDTTLPVLEALPPALQAIRPVDRLDSLGESRSLLLHGTRYFAVPLRPPAGPMIRRSWCFTPRPVGGRPDGRRQCRPWPSALGTLGVMAAVTSWIAHRISGRIRRVQAQVARIAAGDFEGFDPGRRGDEVQDLAGSINRMCTQLKQMQGTIRQSERTRLLAQLAAGLAHQLRNSLTGARMSVQLHAKRFPPPAATRRSTSPCGSWP